MTVVPGRFFWERLGTKSFLFGYPRNEKRQKSFPLSLLPCLSFFMIYDKFHVARNIILNAVVIGLVVQ